MMFRGIRKIELDLKGQNFAACGPNGTGKSGIVDAIEFGLTGSISRLEGQGTASLSVKQHGPHVDFRNNPEKARVSLEVSIPSLGGKRATITRTVKNLGTPKIEPAEPAVLAALQGVRSHPEFVLSRRELIRYVLSQPSKRAEQVGALLRLEEIEKLRAVLLKISNAYAKELAPLKRMDADATQQLTTALGIAQLSKAAILEAVNKRRITLGLALLPDLTATTSLIDGLATGGSGTAPQRVAKAQAKLDLETLKNALAELSGETFKAGCLAVRADLTALADDPASAEGVKRQTLLNSALELYDGEHCPVCDQNFETDSFVAHLKEKLSHLDDIAEKRKKIETAIEPLLLTIQTVGDRKSVV